METTRRGMRRGRIRGMAAWAISCLLLALFFPSCKEKPTGTPAAAGGDRCPTRQSPRDRSTGADGQHAGRQDGAASCAGCGVSRKGPVPGRPVCQERPVALSHTAEHLSGRLTAGRGRNIAAKGTVGVRLGPIRPLLGAVHAEGSVPIRRGQLALPEGFRTRQPGECAGKP